MEDHQFVIEALQQKMNYKQLFQKIRQGNLGFLDALTMVVYKLLRSPNTPNQDYLILLSDLFYLSLDLQLYHTSDQVLKVLLKKFPDSERIARMKGLILEATGDDENAQIIYTQKVQENLVDYGARKRKISLFRKQHNYEQAVRSLNQYLSDFPQDVEAWMELADIYMETLNFHKAVFCYEEVILLNPTDLHYLIKLAELNYSNQNFPIAKNYYCFVLSKNPTDTRALWGLLQTLRKSKQKDQDQALAVVTVKALQKHYGNSELVKHYPFESILASFE